MIEIHAVRQFHRTKAVGLYIEERTKTGFFLCPLNRSSGVS